MRPTLCAWANAARLKKVAACVATLLTLGFFGAGNSFAQEPTGVGDLEPTVVVDSVLPFDAPLDTAGFGLDSSVVAVPVDSVPVASAPIDSAPVAETPEAGVVPALPESQKTVPQKTVPQKTVLYLSGGERSPWFHLGVLYAIEEFKIPVDSIVATSWGAWIGALWSRGVSPDEIQRIMLDSDISPYVGKNLIDEQERAHSGIPLSEEGLPSLRRRYSLARSTDGEMDWYQRNLLPDSMDLKKNLARLRFQETLYRLPIATLIPFALMGCNEGAASELREASVEQIINSLPLWKSGSENTIGMASGELCPFFALPAEDNPNELSIVVVASPLRNPPQGDVKNQLLQKMASAHLTNQPGLIVRAHAIADTSRKAWIQAGFSAMEQRRTSYSELSSRKVDYRSRRVWSSKPWFRFNPALDNLSPAVHGAVKSYWADADTGMAGPRNFLNRVQKNPSYDSLKLSMAYNGDLMVESAVHPTFDFAVGGFGSNAIGPMAHGEASLNFVDHVELNLKLAGFLGEYSYGFLPRMEVSKLWGLPWGISLGYNYLKLQAMPSFRNDLDMDIRFEYEKRQDLNLNMYYDVDERQRVSAEFLFGERVFTLDSVYFGYGEIATYPVSPALRYSYSNASEKGWFSTDGVDLNVVLGMESIGFNAGIIDLIPIYWKILLDAQYAVSPKPWLSFSVGAAGGMERYHEDGYGYVYPKSFEFAPLDLAYRLHAQATPWSTEWYDPELSSHEYGMIRFSGSAHFGYLGAWLFGAYYHDFEDSPLATLGHNRFVFEPALRFSYKSLKLYMGMNKVVDRLGDLTKLSSYNYFIRVGEYSF